jgi:hypothetical protein
MTIRRRLCPWIFTIAMAGLAISPPAPARADWIGAYWPLWVGNSWTYRNVDVPGDTYTDTVFEYLIFEGDQAVKLGRPGDYRVIGNTGRVVTVYAEFQDGEFVDYPQNVVVGEFGDGTVFEICAESPCDTNLVRDWDAIDPSLRAPYGLDPSWDDLVLVVAYDRGQPPNPRNVVAASHLPAGRTPPAGAVTSLEWFQRGLGQVAITDVEAQTGALTNFYQLMSVHVGVADPVASPAAVTLEPNAPNPFNPRTTIPYVLDEAARTTLAIYDLAGRRVRHLLADTPIAAGKHTAVWDGRDDHGCPQPAGIYVCRLQARGESHARRLTLVR